MNVNLSTFSDEDLLFEYRAFGETACFNELVRRYRPSLERYFANKYNLDRNFLEEAVQETFCRIWKKCDQFDVTRPLRPWIYKVAASQATDLLRKNGRYKSFVSLDAPKSEEDPGYQLINDIESSKPDPATEYERTDSANYVRSIVSTLSERYRTVVEKIYYQGMTCQSVAKALNTTPATISRRLSKALRIMHAAMVL